MTTPTPGRRPEIARPDNDVSVAEIPAWILFHPHISPGAKCLYGAISVHLRDGYRWPDTLELAHLLQIAERTVRAHLRELVEAGAVHRERGVGYSTGRRYRLTGATGVRS